MPKLTAALDELANTTPAYQQAALNCQRDLRSENNPHGNIPEAVTAELEQQLDEAAEPPDSNQWQQWAQQHNCIGLPKHYQSVEPNCQQLVKVMSYRHLKRQASKAKSASRPQALPSYSVQRQQAAELPAYKPMTGEDYREQEFKGKELEGSSGNPADASWWSFATDEQKLEYHCANQYMQALALSPRQIDQARLDGFALLVSIDRADLQQKLYKPSALNALNADTLFRPDLSARNYGLTAPTKANGADLSVRKANGACQPVAEVVSATIEWRQLGDNMVQIRAYHFDQNTQEQSA